MINVGNKVYWCDPDDDISSGEYWVTGKNGEILYLQNEGSSEIEAFEDECTVIF